MSDCGILLNVLILLVTYAIALDPWAIRAPLPIEGYGGHRSDTLSASIYEFGGVRENITLSGPARFVQFYAALRRYNALSNSWTFLPAAGEPSARAFHGQARVSRWLYIYGGLQQSFVTPLGDFHRYDTYSATWTQLPNPPSGGRIGMSMAALGSKIVMFGGNNFNFLEPNPVHVLNDTWIYDHNSGLWTDTNHFGPQGRTNAHTFLFAGKMCIHGGEADIDEGPLVYLGDMWCYTIGAGWKQVTYANTYRLFNFAAVDSIGSNIIFHGGDFGSCDRDLITTYTTIFDMSGRMWHQGVYPHYLSGPASKRGQLSCIGYQCYHTGAYAPSPMLFEDIVCEVQQTYLNNTYVLYALML